jgi:hypothetical protein
MKRAIASRSMMLIPNSAGAAIASYSAVMLPVGSDDAATPVSTPS